MVMFKEMEQRLQEYDSKSEELKIQESAAMVAKERKKVYEAEQKILALENELSVLIEAKLAEVGDRDDRGQKPMEVSETEKEL